MPHRPLLHYQYQHSSQTLRQGLDEYFAAHPGLPQGRDLSPAAQSFFDAHDRVHVVYGCNISLTGEAAVKLASICGTTAGLAVLKGYALHESRQIYRQLRPADVLRNLVPALWAAPRVCWRCSQQTARWPWDTPADHLHTRRHCGPAMASA